MRNPSRGFRHGRHRAFPPEEPLHPQFSRSTIMTEDNVNIRLERVVRMLREILCDRPGRRAAKVSGRVGQAIAKTAQPCDGAKEQAAKLP